ncbi:MAG: aminotransferase class III-fold pyridoxal phosphate-dependent enzyme [Pseudomonadota bacterium]
MGLFASKAELVAAFGDHVSSGKAAFWRLLNMDFVIGKRQGCWMWDVDGGKKLFNLHGNGGVYNLGHRNPEIVKALTEALAEVDIGNGHLISEARAALGKKISDLSPGDLDYTVFGVSGGEAVDLAIKVARGFTGREKIISAHGGYHGHTGLALAAGDEKYRSPFGPPAPGFVQVPFADVPALEKELAGGAAAVLLETIPATLGMPIPPPEYFKQVRGLCTENGALLILDEVQTGLGRTGKFWAFEHFGIIPDMAVLGKGLSGGLYPITATVLRRPLEAVFHPDPHIHVSTFGGAELGCRTALKVLEISSTPDFLARVVGLSEVFREGIARLAAKHDLLKGLRQLGLFMGLELEDQICGPLLCAAAYQNGLFMVYANNDKSVCQFLPPLIIDDREVEFVLERLDSALADTASFRAVI